MSENGGYTATLRNHHWNLTLNPSTTKWGQWSSWSAVFPTTVRHVRCLNPHCWLNTTLSSVNPFFWLMKTTFLSWWNPHLPDKIPTCFSVTSPFCGWSPSVCLALRMWQKIPMSPRLLPSRWVPNLEPKSIMATPPVGLATWNHGAVDQRLQGSTNCGSREPHFFCVANQASPIYFDP